MFVYIVGSLFALLLTYIVYVLLPETHDNTADTSLDAFIIETKVDENKAQEEKQDPYSWFYDKPGRQILILYGTEYGFSEEIAKRVFDRILATKPDDDQSPWQPRLVNMKMYENIDFTREHVIFVVVSTAGDGIPPTEARPFCSWLSQCSLDLSHISYSVLALGDSNYPHFCRTGKTINKRLSELHCHQVISCHHVDMEDWTVIDRWIEQVIECLDTLNVQTCLDYLVPQSSDEDIMPSRSRPFMAKLMSKRLLTSNEVKEEDWKETIHCEFDLTTSGITWTSGDALGIYPENNPSEVDFLLAAMNASGEMRVDTPKWIYHPKPNDSITLRQALMKYYDLKTVKPELMQILQKESKGTACQEKLDSLLSEGLSKMNQQLHDYLYESEVADVLQDFAEASSKLSVIDILNKMKSLQPRYYSISSSPLINKDSCSLTVAVVRYITRDRHRSGVATTYLQDRLNINQILPVFISQNPEFRLPANSERPIIMIGPGTGLAPFMAFISERRFTKATGTNRLYFGCRHKQGDYLYKQELEQWAAEGCLELRVAFSRDQPQKIYVQNLIQEDGDIVWKMINDHKAHIYICGDAKNMAKDVHKELIKIVADKGSMSSEESEKFLMQLETEGRYQKDVWVT